MLAQTAALTHPDSVDFRVRQQLDSFKLELQKAESQKLAEEAREMRKDADKELDWVVKMMGVLVGLITIIIAISGVYWLRTQRQVAEALRAAVKSTREKVEKEIRPQVEAVLVQIQVDARAAADEKVKGLTLQDIGQPVSKDDLKRLREVDERLKGMEQKGGRLTSNDHFLRARRWQEDGLFDLALASYNDAITEDRSNANAWSGRAYCLAQLERYDDSIRACKEVLKIDPKHHIASNNKGATFLILKRYEDAVKAFDEALGSEPNYPLALYNRSMAYAQLLKKDDSLKDLKRAVVLNQDYRADAKAAPAFEPYRSDPEFKKIVGE